MTRLVILFNLNKETLECTNQLQIERLPSQRPLPPHNSERKAFPSRPTSTLTFLNLAAACRKVKPPLEPNLQVSSLPSLFTKASLPKRVRVVLELEVEDRLHLTRLQPANRRWCPRKPEVSSTTSHPSALSRTHLKRMTPGPKYTTVRLDLKRG